MSRIGESVAPLCRPPYYPTALCLDPRVCLRIRTRQIGPPTQPPSAARFGLVHRAVAGLYHLAIT